MTEVEDFKYKICCMSCADEIVDEDSPIFLAMFGPQGDIDVGQVLAAPEWDERNPFVIRGIAHPFFCDGCGCKVSVAPSSMWFIEEHRKERSA